MNSTSNQETQDSMAGLIVRRFIGCTTIVVALMCVVQISAQAQTSPPARPAQAGAGGSGTAGSDIMRKRSEHVIGGTLMHEHLQTAFGSGRVFGNARPVPHARVNLVELDGVVPRRINPDPQDVRVLSASSACTAGNRRFGWEAPIATPHPGRLHIELVAEMRPGGTSGSVGSVPRTRITHGDTFSPYETNCTELNGGDACTPDERWELTTTERVEAVADCMKDIAHEDEAGDYRVDCDPGDFARTVEVEPAIMEEAYLAALAEVENDMDEWRNADNLTDALFNSYENEVLHTEQLIAGQLAATKHQVEVVE